MTINDEQRAAVLAATRALGDYNGEHQRTRKLVPRFDEYDSGWEDACTCGGRISYADKKCTKEKAALELLDAFDLA